MPRRKHALLIGIDAYPRLPRGARLEGARADAECMAALLVEHMGFAAGDVELLTDEDATRAGIIAGLGRLLDRVRDGDVVWFHFSGHGSRRLATTGWLRADRRENVLVPHDSAHEGGRPNRGISGNELHAWLRHLSNRTRRTTLVLDCCHAGTMTREDDWHRDQGRTRTVPSDNRPPAPTLRTFPWPAFDRSLPVPGESGWWPASASYTLIAACRADQRAREVTVRERGREPRHHGALSHALLTALGEAPRPTTYAALHARVTAAVRGRYPNQHPQIEGPADRHLMRLATASADRARTVIGRHGDRLRIDGGSVHGVAPGSVWAITPPDQVPTRAGDTAASGPPPRAGGRARVTRVGGVRSEAVWLGDVHDVPDPVVGWRASLDDAGQAPPVLTVAIEVAAAREAWAGRVGAGVDAAPSLRRVLDRARADVVVTVTEPREPGRGAEGIRLDRRFGRPAVVLLDRDDRVVAPVRWPVDAVAAADTVAVLESLARHRHLRALRAPPSPLDGTVETRLLRREPGSMVWTPAAPAESDGPPAFDHREPFALILSNTGPDDVYVHVVAVGAGGGIGIVFPRGGACEALAAGHRVWVGDRPGEALWFEVPDTVPFARPGARPWRGEEMLLTIVTDDATDLRPLFQSTFREAAWQDAAQAHTCAAALGDLLSHGYREAGSTAEPRPAAWTVERQVVTLRRPRRG